MRETMRTKRGAVDARSRHMSRSMKAAWARKTPEQRAWHRAMTILGKRVKAANKVAAALFEITPQSDPCGECRLRVGETCSICGATNHGDVSSLDTSEPHPMGIASLVNPVIDATGDGAARPSSRASISADRGKRRLTQHIGQQSYPATVFPRYEAPLAETSTERGIEKLNDIKDIGE